MFIYGTGTCMYYMFPLWIYTYIYFYFSIKIQLAGVEGLFNPGGNSSNFMIYTYHLIIITKRKCAANLYFFLRGCGKLFNLNLLTLSMHNSNLDFVQLVLQHVRCVVDRLHTRRIVYSTVTCVVTIVCVHFVKKCFWIRFVTLFFSAQLGYNFGEYTGLNFVSWIMFIHFYLLL
jgi:hypothetical protein